MKNVRRFFRYDLKTSFLVRVLNQDPERDLVLLKDSDINQNFSLLELKLDQLERQLTESSQQQLAGTNLFMGLAKMLSFCDFMLRSFHKGESPKLNPNYTFQLKWWRQYQFPSPTLSGDKVKSLIMGLYESIRTLLLRLLKMTESGLDDCVFLYDGVTSPTFEHEKYVENLADLVQKKVPQAIKVDLISSAYNLANDLFNDICRRSDRILDQTGWPAQVINLSEGGVAIEANQPYKRFSTLEVILQLDEAYLRVEGKLVVCQKIGVDRYKVTMDFEFIDAAKQQKIKYFILRSEVKEAMDFIEASV
jgi:hypothetical protein